MKKNRSGFTLVELLIVMGVLGVIIGTTFFALNPLEQFQKARDAQRKNDLAQIQRALETFYNDFGQYPESTSNYQLDSDTTASVTEINWGEAFSPYMTTLPKDPNTNRRYVYSSTGESYRIYASLERGSKDSSVCNADGSVCDNAPATATFPCGTSTSEICNYGVSSSNVSP